MLLHHNGLSKEDDLLTVTKGVELQYEDMLPTELPCLVSNLPHLAVLGLSGMMMADT